ncbi:MAG: RimJ/RimL family protein N-acetyltransferase [Candidatus Endobugula sp.]|jgi:RimJ/RimL family protein N-acetyltransferase
MTFQYRWLNEISETEQSQIRQLFIASIEDEGMLGFDESDDEDISSFIYKLAAKVKNNISQVLLIVDESTGDPVGTVVLTRVQHKTSCHIAELSKVIISPGFRGSGVLKNGIRELCVLALELGVSRFVFDVREGTESATLWSGLGFETYGRLEDYSHYKGKQYPGLFMTSSVSGLLEKYQKKK